jgi:predicted transcriptional regulator
MELVAKDLMETKLLFAKADWHLEELAKFLIDHNISGAPVLDAQGKTVGVVSATDMVRLHASTTDRQQTVATIMTPKIHCVGVQTPISEVVKEMLTTHRHRLFVEDKDKIVGINTTFNLLQFIDENLEGEIFTTENLPDLSL